MGHFFPLLIVVGVMAVLGAHATDDSSGGDPELLQKIHDKCFKSTGIQEEDIENFKKGEAVDNENFKCFFKCLMMGAGSMTPQGDVDIPAFLKSLPDSRKKPAKEMLENCDHFTDDDLCERAYKICKCARDTDPEHFFIF